MSDISDLLGSTIGKNPIDFANAFDDIVREKAAAALENKRIELAKSIYGAENEDEFDDLEDQDDDAEDDDDIDLEDLDIDDIDIDLDDLDLNDDEGTDEDA